MIIELRIDMVTVTYLYARRALAPHSLDMEACRLAEIAGILVFNVIAYIRCLPISQGFCLRQRRLYASVTIVDLTLKWTGAALTTDAACASDRKKARRDSSHDNSLPMFVSKAIRDNLKRLDRSRDRHMRESEGKTCRGRITALTSLNIGDKRGYPLGKTFYAELREIYRAADSPRKLVKTAGGEEVRPELLVAIITYKTSGARSDMTSHLQTCDTVNTIEPCGVLLCALELRASTSNEQLRVREGRVDCFGGEAGQGFAPGIVPAHPPMGRQDPESH